ncbi:MAG TPA: Ada metal-binding domain-containing protein [Armatimonadota bacterium]|nr:Ada metal-binding domain-containing protein [Armatimonadota bacterium]
MNRPGMAWWLVALVWMSGVSSALGAEPKKPVSFGEAVIEKAISLMPADQQAKLSAVQKELMAGLKPDVKAGKALPELVYFMEKKEGNGPAELAEQFRLARKAVGQKSPYAALAPALGRLARCVIALCQPYHTGEAAFKGPAHAVFEKGLDEGCALLKADFDEYQKVSNPSEFAVQIAKVANEELKKLGAPGNADPAVRSAVFSLASNSVADCWWTLLVAQDSAVGNYIGNKRSLKFHLPTCRYLPAEKNRVYFNTREEAINEGYVPCKICKP